MNKIRIWPAKNSVVGDQTQVNVFIEGVGGNREHLWYRLPIAFDSALTSRCDPFVIGLLFNAMQSPADMIVHGQVSPSLMQNLEEFQYAWTAWRPETYSKIDILADEEFETQKLPSSAGVTAFSGGVDSSYTVFRHRTGLSRWARRDLRAGLMVLGFDLSLEENEFFHRAFRHSQMMLESMDMALIPMVTNLRLVTGAEFDSFGTTLGSCLSLLAGGFTYGLIPSEYSYTGLKFPWTMNPVTDPLMSSETFRIFEDGAALLRFEKIRVVSDWPEFLQNLRVCFHPGDEYLNCSRCEKCIRTILGFRAWGLGLPSSFKHDISLKQILKLKFSSTLQVEQYTDIVKNARNSGDESPWVLVLRIAIYWNLLKRRALKSAFLRDFHQRLFQR